MFEQLLNVLFGPREDRPHWAMFEHEDHTEVLCSRCGFELEPSSVTTEDIDDEYEAEITVYKTPRYCPYCGAKMENWKDPWWA